MLGLLLVSGCGLPAGLSPIFPTPVSPTAENIYRLYELISIPAVAIFVLVEALLLIKFVIRFRRNRQKPGYVPPQVHGNTALEIAWTVGPLVVVLAIATLSFVELQDDFAINGTTIAAGAGPTDLEIQSPPISSGGTTATHRASPFTNPATSRATSHRSSCQLAGWYAFGSAAAT